VKKTEVQHAVEQFLYRQADLLDSKKWQEYVDLFAADGIYWVPADPAHTTWDGMPAIFAEDKNLMAVRMKRVLHPDAWSQRPAWWHESRRVERHDRQGREERRRARALALSHDGAAARRRAPLRRLVYSPPEEDEKRLRIKLQRVDMTNAQAAYDYVLQVWV
jgi:hypothetical protein